MAQETETLLSMPFELKERLLINLIEDFSFASAVTLSSTCRTMRAVFEHMHIWQTKRDYFDEKDLTFSSLSSIVAINLTKKHPVSCCYVCFFLFRRKDTVKFTLDNATCVACYGCLEKLWDRRKIVRDLSFASDKLVAAQQSQDNGTLHSFGYVLSLGFDKETIERLPFVQVKARKRYFPVTVLLEMWKRSGGQIGIDAIAAEEKRIVQQRNQYYQAFYRKLVRGYIKGLFPECPVDDDELIFKWRRNKDHLLGMARWDAKRIALHYLVDQKLEKEGLKDSWSKDEKAIYFDFVSRRTLGLLLTTRYNDTPFYFDEFKNVAKAVNNPNFNEWDRVVEQRQRDTWKRMIDTVFQHMFAFTKFKKRFLGNWTGPISVEFANRVLTFSFRARYRNLTLPSSTLSYNETMRTEHKIIIELHFWASQNHDSWLGTTYDSVTLTQTLQNIRNILAHWVRNRCKIPGGNFAPMSQQESRYLTPALVEHGNSLINYHMCSFVADVMAEKLEKLSAEEFATVKLPQNVPDVVELRRMIAKRPSLRNLEIGENVLRSCFRTACLRASP